MGLSDDADDNIFKRHQELCNNLNMDKDAADEAWQSYETIRQNYTLEGDQLHWLACALYVACRKSSTPTVGRTGTMVEGNCVSLTRLLRLCKLSLIRFFDKSKKWADMANLPREFCSKIDKLERNFAVSMVIFKKYQPIFLDMFHNPADDEQMRQPRSRKHRSLPSTPSRVFDFCWTLFVCVKGKFPGVSDDLVNSYHLLLAACDLMFANALLSDRRDLLNPDFSGLPKNFTDADYTPPVETPCIIDQLCKKNDGITLEAMGIKEYNWKPHIKKLFDSGVLKGKAANLSGLLEVNSFDHNFKAISKIYEEYVLSEGDFDERIFLDECKRFCALGSIARRCHLIAALIRALPARQDSEGEDASTDIGTPTKSYGMVEFTEKIQAKRARSLSMEKYKDTLQQLIPNTPLTGRRYLQSKEMQPNVTPISTATQSVSRLQLLLSGRQAAPSDILVELFKSCSGNPQEKIEGWVKELGQTFCTRYTQHTDDHPGKHMDFARKRLQLGESLYYKLLENILVEERKKKPDLDVTNLLEQEIFHQTLLACCLEIVIYSYNSQRTFPWILEALGLEPYYFYKVIEVIVKAEDQLSRDMVKHLNLIEEQILESMAWRSESPLWENIRNSGQPVPTCEDVCLPGQLDVSVANPTIRRLTTGTASTSQNPPQSPVSSVSERFQSPVGSGLAKKRLFTEGPTNVTRMSLVKPGQSLLQTSAKTMSINIQTIEGENGQRYIPISYVAGTSSVIIQAQPSGVNSPSKGAQSPVKPQKPKRTGSLSLFFRKFYHLASVRMQELCNHLNVSDTDLKRKIWTCFEHTVTTSTELMKDRHLDQILMCTVYVICKVAQSEKTFTEIMRCYRMQPQAASHVYRSVLLSTKRRRGSGSSSSNGTSSTSSPIPSEDVKATTDEHKDGIRSSSTLPVTAPPTPTHLAGTSSSFECEDRGDLIKFYNTIYVQQVKEFAPKLSSSGDNENLTLSPLPLTRNQPMSPYRRVSDKHSVFIRSMPASPLPQEQQQLSYCFSRSPAKDLRAINNMIQVDASRRTTGKRLALDDISEGDVSPPKQPAPVVAKRLHDLIGDRLGQQQE